MNWKGVAVLAIFVIGAVTAHALGGKELALTLAGAAAGYASHSSRERSPPA